MAIKFDLQDLQLVVSHLAALFVEVKGLVENVCIRRSPPPASGAPCLSPEMEKILGCSVLSSILRSEWRISYTSLLSLCSTLRTYLNMSL